MSKYTKKSLQNLHLSPNSIVSTEEFNHLMGIEDGIYLGDPLSPSLELFTNFIELWVDRIEYRLSLVKTNSPIYFLLYTNRGFTYHEYKILFKEIQEEKYQHYPIFSFLRINSKDQLVEFRVGLEENLESYFQLLYKTFESTNRTGITFFLRKLKTLLPLRELQRHCYICGATGSGKSELMRLLFYNLQQSSQKGNTRSLVLIDPHGDLSLQIKSSKLNKDSDRLIYIEPELRKDWSPVINPLEIEKKDDTSIVARAQFLSNAIQEAVGTDLSVNMGAILIPSIALLLRMENTTLLDLVKLMKDDKSIIAKGRNQGIKAHRIFFENYLDPHYKKTKTAIYTKLQAFLNFPAFYNMVVGKSTIDLGKAINSGKVVIFNLSQGVFGVEASQAFGRFVISLIKSHVIVRKQYRKPTYLFIDECQNYVSPSIQSILEEARKYGLHLIMSNQTVERLKNIEDVVLSNTSVKLIGKSDSIKTTRKMSSITGTDNKIFQNLRNYHFYIKTSLINGEIFKVSDALILDSSRTLNKEEIRELNKKIIDKYYRNINDEMQQIEDSEDDLPFDL